MMSFFSQTRLYVTRPPELSTDIVSLKERFIFTFTLALQNENALHWKYNKLKRAITFSLRKNEMLEMSEILTKVKFSGSYLKKQVCG